MMTYKLDDRKDSIMIEDIIFIVGVVLREQ